jgi:hypothetical protein
MENGGGMATAFRKLDLEQIKREISGHFNQALGAKTKPVMTTEEKAEVLFAVALRKMRYPVGSRNPVDGDSQVI